ncbi:MAG: glycosyltransferase family 2 protein, partial [Actinomycetota bacterium]|nr:glycosyltransferase family 2 protein [Actinomycetota bacterium]
MTSPSTVSRVDSCAQAARPVPEATIVITTHDRPELARRAVRSALAQTVRDVEVIVVDDGSQEPFHLSERDDRARVLFTGEAAGVCAARNIGLQAARGRWITFLDDDDELLPNMLEESLLAARNSQLPSPVAVLSGIE